jgi:stearoyl-CoA desaturase (delta-9 desaturase)
MHRTHHQHSDDADDPHSPAKYSAFKLFFLTVDLSSCDSAMLNSKDLIRDKTLRILHKYYLEVAVLSMLVMLCISWQVLAVYFVGVLYTLIGVFFSVYPYHKKSPFNYTNHVTGDDSHNNLWSGLLFHGEAYHNNHHNNPGAISNAEKWFEWDANKWFINLIRKR